VDRPLPSGTYYWLVAYSGDSHNQPSASRCGDETLTVSSPPYIGGLAFSSRTAVTLAVSCPVALCKVRITITTPALLTATDARSRGKSKPPVITLARGTVTIRKHGARKATLRLTSAGRRFIASHHGRLTVTATIAAFIHGHTRTLTGGLTLKITRRANAGRIDG
jgi:hypothetical protein